MHRLGITFPPYPLVDDRFQRTEVDVANLSADPANKVMVVAGHPHDIAVLPLLPVHPLENAESQKEIYRPEQGRPAKIGVRLLHSSLKICNGENPREMDQLRHNGRALRRQTDTMVLDGPTHLFSRIHGDPFVSKQR